MLSTTPDHHSRKVVYNLHLALLGSACLLVFAIMFFLRKYIGILALPGALVLAGVTSSFVDLVIICCTRSWFRANAFLKKSWRNLINFALSWCLYSLLCTVLLVVVYKLPGIFFGFILPVVSPGLAQSMEDPYLAGGASFSMGYFLWPVFLLIGIVLCLPAILLFVAKIAIMISNTNGAKQGKVIKYPFSKSFVGGQD